MARPPGDQELFDALISGHFRSILLDLYPMDRGYTLTIPGLNCTDTKTRCFNYDEDFELLEFISRGEVPYMLVDLLEKFCPVQIFYKGSLAVQVRNHTTLFDTKRDELASQSSSSSSSCSLENLIFLKPTALSLMADLSCLLSQCSKNRNQLKRLEELFWKFMDLHGISASDSSTNKASSSLVPDVAKLSGNLKSGCQMECLFAESLNLFGLMNGDMRPRIAEYFNSNFLTSIRKDFKKETSSSSWRPMLQATRTPLEILEKRNLLVADESGLESDDDSIILEQYSIEFESTADKNNLQEKTSDSKSPDHGQIELLTKNPRTTIAIKRKLRDWTYTGRLTLERGKNCPSLSSEFILGSRRVSTWLYVKQYFDMSCDSGKKPCKIARQLRGQSNAEILQSEEFSRNLNDLIEKSKYYD